MLYSRAVKPKPLEITAGHADAGNCHRLPTGPHPDAEPPPRHPREVSIMNKYPTSKSQLTITTYRVGPDGTRGPQTTTVTGEITPPLSMTTWPACRCRMCPGGRTAHSAA